MYYVLSLVGPPGHGKTSLLAATRSSAYMSTMEPSKHVVPRADNTFLEIWDTPGLLRYTDAAEHTMRRCDAHLLVLRRKLDDMARYERWVHTKPGKWVVIALGDTDALGKWANALGVSFCHVDDADDAWAAAERALRYISPRIKSDVLEAT